MGKLFDYCMTGDWEQTQRIALYKKLGKKLDEMTQEELKELIKKMNKI
jgi:hypothetical protein